ncbi:hypothetical protein RchiOBHm_Chr7g0203751 [Rosa chinensis]|uniref:Uncharacterized protein n=1 Tax=Rosa chinensis TaxID=74649 RepID=A0A2P6P8H8_ROSCH|nr:hypothetical protein RchiOBHm_Chr7g0203751 [Rosa chinensis]
MKLHISHQYVSWAYLVSLQFAIFNISACEAFSLFTTEPIISSSS